MMSYKLGGSNMSRFAEKVIVITGGGSGLGRECAFQWAAEGASLVVSDIVEDRALKVAEEIGLKGGKAHGIKADVSVESEVEATVQAAIDTFGHIDVMFANAGRSMTPRSEGGGSLALEDVTQAQWDDVTNVNFRGVFFSGKHACRAMKEQGFGNIVVTVSAAASNSYPGIAVYGAGKAGLLGLIRGMATDWGKYGIRVNGLAPTHGMSVNFGLPLSAPVEGLSYEEFGIRNSGRAWNPKQSFPGPLKVQRPPSLRDNAAVASFLASDDSQYMSGITIPSCDGGSVAISSMHFPDDWSLEEQISTVASEGPDD
jgi:NAD(P)-dependent dehydrogenase (short-subunit alcohol dehydrogenase family)